MAKTATKPVELSRKERVVASEGLRDVPEGTEGTVTMVSGFTWIRYWVRFDNGVVMGSINRSKLARPEEWQRKLNGEAEPSAGAGAADRGDGAEASTDGASEGAAGGDVTTSNGAVVPARLIERSQRARQRVSA